MARFYGLSAVAEQALTAFSNPVQRGTFSDVALEG